MIYCYGCGNPETKILISKTPMVSLKCAACGFVSDVTDDKLTILSKAKNRREEKTRRPNKEHTINS